MAKKKMALAPDPLPDPTISPLGVPGFFPYIPFLVTLVKETPWPEDIVVDHAECDEFVISVDNWHIHNESSYGNILHIILVARFDFFAKSFKTSAFTPLMDSVEITITLEDGTGTEQDILVPSLCVIEVG